MIHFFPDLEFSESTMDVASGVLKKFDSFLVSCHSHLRISDTKHIVPNVTLLEVRKLCTVNITWVFSL